MSRPRKVALPTAVQFELNIGSDLATSAPVPSVVYDRAELSPSLPEPLETLEAADPSIGQVLGFCPRLLSDLFEPTTLTCRRRNGQWVIVTTSATVYAEARSTLDAAVFTGRELAAMALAAEHERGTPAAVAEWSVRNREDPSWRLNADHAIGAVTGRFEARGWNVGEVFARLGLELVGVVVGDSYAAGGAA